MRETQPQVHLIAKPQIDYTVMQRYLKSVGGEEWFNRIWDDHSRWVNSAEMLVEFAGRMCYRSWKPGLNANVTKVRTESAEYFANLLKSAHGSVLEHANFTFVFQDVSRVFTHELVRHRAGSAFSQESLRYVRLTDLSFRVAPALEPLHDRVIEIVEQLEEFQVEAAAELGLDDEGVPFHIKKEVTSALRRLAPIGLSTSIVWTANVRTIRHVLASRTAVGAEEEIRQVFHEVGNLMSRETPLLLQDFTCQAVDEANVLPPAWVPSNPVAGQTRV